jgi:hypothetical protein
LFSSRLCLVEQYFFVSTRLAQVSAVQKCISSRFAVVEEAPGNIGSRDALHVQLELNKVILLVFLIPSLILSIVIGVVAGVWRHSLDSGSRVGGGILGWMGIVEGFLTWWLK